MTDALARLMPNLGGPGDSVRRIYAGAVMFYIMWAGEAESNAKTRRALYMVQRKLALRLARA